ncbi:MAG: thioredoxin-disulfide reductase [Gemmatimonadota bacterium]|nr:thioredoxin-disulfide reductase [Gemmatimonadota bacterium]
MEENTTGQVENHEVIIVGAGPAGLCAALYAGRSEMDAVMLEAGFPGGQLLLTELVDDYPGVEDVGGMELAQKMADHAKKFGVEATRGQVEKVRREDDGYFVVEVERGKSYRAPAVIYTAGGTPRALDVPGEKEYMGRGVSYCAICDGAFFKGEKIAVIGGGDSAVEEGEFLTRYGSSVTLVHRRDELRAQAVLQHRFLDNEKTDVIWDTVVEEILGEDGNATGLALRNVKTGEKSELSATGVFIFVGFTPNVNVIDFHVDHDPAGYIRTDRDMRTDVPGFFVAGDVRSQLVRQITTAVGDATTAVFAAEKYLQDLEEGHGVEASEDAPAAETQEAQTV